MKIVLRKNEDLHDWYQIVRAEHDGRQWMEPAGKNCSRFMMSERLSPEACIEGNGMEMLALAHAIKGRYSDHFKRCAVLKQDKGYLFSSPKNSHVPVFITFEEADDFADQVMKELK